jgi:hypothetical protein
VDAEEKTPAEKPPVLSYSSIPREPRDRKLLLARKAAAWFAGLSLLLGTPLLILWLFFNPVGPNRDVDELTVIGILSAMTLIDCILAYIIATLSCWIRLSASPARLEMKRKIWPFAAIYMLVAFGLLWFAVRSQSAIPMLIWPWLAIVPMVSNLFLLRPSRD